MQTAKEKIKDPTNRKIDLASISFFVCVGVLAYGSWVFYALQLKQSEEHHGSAISIVSTAKATHMVFIQSGLNSNNETLSTENQAFDILGPHTQGFLLLPKELRPVPLRPVPGGTIAIVKLYLCHHDSTIL